MFECLRKCCGRLCRRGAGGTRQASVAGGRDRGVLVPRDGGADALRLLHSILEDSANGCFCHAHLLPLLLLVSIAQ